MLSDHLNLILPPEDPFNRDILQLKVSFKMGLFSDTKHTHPWFARVGMNMETSFITGLLKMLS